MPHGDSTQHEVFLNGEKLVSSAVTLEALLTEQGYQGRKVATAVNGDFVPERSRRETRLSTGDKVEVVSARQGG